VFTWPEASHNPSPVGLVRFSVRQTWATATAVLSLAIALSGCGNPQAGTGPSGSRFLSIDIWPPAPRPAPAFMLSTWVAPLTQSHADFYGWDGSYRGRLKRQATSLPRSPVATSLTSPPINSGARLVSWSGGSPNRHWIRDRHHSTGLPTATISVAWNGPAGYALVVEDVAGKVQGFHLHVPADLISPDGLRALGIECSLTSTRAVVFGGSLPHCRAAGHVAARRAT